MKKFNNKGFTLIEILIVIVIIAILALVVFVALNPVGRIADSNNTTMTSNIQQIFKSIQQYTVDNKGALPTLPQLTSPAIVTSGTAYGYDIQGNTTGTPSCATTTTGTLPTQVATVVVSGADSCETLAAFETAVPTMKNYLTSNPGVGGNVNYYVAENASGTKVLVFATGMQKGATTNTTGYPIAYEYN